MFHLRPPVSIKITPTLNALASELVHAYEATYGSSGPGCNPNGLAAVLDRIALLEGMPRLMEIADDLRGA